jgi:hypothetical protein
MHRDSSVSNFSLLQTVEADFEGVLRKRERGGFMVEISTVSEACVAKETGIPRRKSARTIYQFSDDICRHGGWCSQDDSSQRLCRTIPKEQGVEEPQKRKREQIRQNRQNDRSFALL